MSQLFQSIKDRHLNPFIEPQDLTKIKAGAGNIYKSIAVIARRSNHLKERLTEEVHQEMEVFADVTDTFEEMQESQEQIALSRKYEQLPSTTLVALDEFLQDELLFESDAALKEEESV